MLTRAQKPVVGFAAYSGAGKTTLSKQLLPLLTERGVRIGMIKHAHHNFDIDIPGKDSYELRKAGAAQMLVASARREALVTEKASPSSMKMPLTACNETPGNCRTCSWPPPEWRSPALEVSSVSALLLLS